MSSKRSFMRGSRRSFLSPVLVGVTMVMFVAPVGLYADVIACLNACNEARTNAIKAAIQEEKDAIDACNAVRDISISQCNIQLSIAESLCSNTAQNDLNAALAAYALAMAECGLLVEGTAAKLRCISLAIGKLANEQNRIDANLLSCRNAAALIALSCRSAARQVHQVCSDQAEKKLRDAVKQIDAAYIQCTGGCVDDW